MYLALFCYADNGFGIYSTAMPCGYSLCNYRPAVLPVVRYPLTKRLHKLEKQLEDLEQQILIERSKLTIKYTATKAEEFYKQILILNSEMLVNYAIKQIVLYDGKIAIKLNNPTKRSPHDSYIILYVSFNSLLSSIEDSSKRKSATRLSRLFHIIFSISHIRKTTCHKFVGII